MNRENYDLQTITALQDRINKMNPVDLADELSNLSGLEIALRIKLMDKDLLADTFALLEPDLKTEIIESLSDESIRELVKELDEDELVDTLQELPANLVRRLMNRFVDSDRRSIINELLGYPEESVGSVMSVNFLSVKVGHTPAEAINQVMLSSLDANKLELIWLTDDSLKLIGYVYLADLLRRQEETIEAFAQEITVSVFATDDQETVAKLAHKYDLSEIPVTDSEGRLIGVVPAEWAIDILFDEYEEDISNIHGIQDSKGESYLKRSSFDIAKDRTIWLIVCLITATLTGFVIKRYEAILQASVSLAVYIPMLMDSGGNAGSQSATTIIRAMYTGELSYREGIKVIFKELRIGFVVGLALAVVNTVRMLLLDQVSLAVVLIVSITLLLTVMLSKIMGGILPLLADKLKVDPTIMAGPIITTIVDTVALLIYFEVASILLA